MKKMKTPTIEEVDEKLQEIAYSPAKRPWPRSAKITVWVMGIIIAASAIVNIIAVTQWYGPYQKWIDYNTVYLPIEEPKGEDTPIIMPDLEEIKQNPPDYEVFEPFR